MFALKKISTPYHKFSSLFLLIQFMEKERENKMRQSNLLAFLSVKKNNGEGQKTQTSPPQPVTKPEPKPEPVVDKQPMRAEPDDEQQYKPKKKKWDDEDEPRKTTQQTQFDEYQRKGKLIRVSMEIENEEDLSKKASITKLTNKTQRMSIQEKQEVKPQPKSSKSKTKQPTIDKKKQTVRVSSSDNDSQIQGVDAPKTQGKTQGPTLISGQIEFTQKTPSWALPDNCLDKNKHPVGHPDYDPTTLWVPPKEFAGLTSTMKQYWTIKSQNFDKIVLFKLGKFYELFFEDAYISNKYLNLKWMGTKMHTGFPEKTLDRYVEQLVELGFKVVVVEQMETPDQMNDRIKKDRQSGKKADKTIMRQVTQVLTKGTYTKPVSIEQSESENAEAAKHYIPNYLISVQVSTPIYAFILLDTANNKIIIGHMRSLDEFKTMLYRTRPVEVLFDPSNLPLEQKQMMAESFLGMIQSPLRNMGDTWHPQCSSRILKDHEHKHLFQQVVDNYPQKVRQLIYSALSGLFSYLHNLLLFQNVLATSSFEVYDPQTSRNSNMILDSQALQHLQLLQTSSTYDQQGSLLNLINKCCTPFGKRMMRSWMCSPSTNRMVINQRLDAVEDLIRMPIQRNKLTVQLKNLGDLERLINRLYHYSIKSMVNKAKYFIDVSTNRLQEFKKLFEKLEKSWQVIEVLRKNSKGFKSKRLKSLITVNDGSEQVVYTEDMDQGGSVKGLLPNILKHLQQIQDFVVWKDGKPTPKKGLFDDYDKTVQEIRDLEKEFDKYLDEQKVILKEKRIEYTHTKERYQIEIPLSAENKRPANYIFSSKRQGYNRYITNELKKMIIQFQRAEERNKQQMKLFTTFFFEEFRKKNKIWQTYVRVLAQIDCLLSNSFASEMWKSCRPRFTDDPQAGIKIIQGRHPCLGHILFVPNDVELSSHKSMLLLTGPNMGGKSTLLRMTCVLAIMAQMGMHVPCQSYESIIFDRIFTRIGASDRMLQKKSTFFIEMQQTKSIIDHATRSSLVIIDQLGRGTSTFDGMSIAYSVLKYLCDRIKCMGLFATHYSILVEEFLYKNNVYIGHMGYSADEKTKRINFLYKLREGKCNESFGLNVARMVGINEAILDKAESIANVMKKQVRKKRDAQVDYEITNILKDFSV